MFLSIIIPNYNICKKLLERCIESIVKLNMDKNEYEIIVVDDGSTIPPAWICDTYRDYNVNLIPTKHGGPGAARNRGIEEAKGKYIMFVDADDFLIDNSEIEDCLKILNDELPHILRFRYHVTLTPQKDNFKKGNSVKFGNTISGASFMTNNNLPGSPCLYFFSRELAVKKNIRFPENRLHEDESFNTILHFYAQTLIESNALLYCYCKRKGSTTANSDEVFERKRIEHLMETIAEISEFRNIHYEKSNDLQKRGIDRKLRMLTIDAILNMLYNGMKANDIHERCKKRLTPLSLYPIPAANYSLKYRIFRILANSKAGIKILRIITPSKKPKKK